MITSEQDAIAFAKQVEDLYRRHLGRGIDYSGFASYVLWHLHVGGMSLSEVDEILSWGEIPPYPQAIIADGWDPGWPMLIAGRDEAGQDADIDRAIAMHRNTMLVLVANPDTGNPPTFLRSRRFATVPWIHLGPDITKAQFVAQRIQERGLRVHYVLWSNEAEQAFGDGKRRVKDFGAALPAASDVWCIETDEYWSDGDLDEVGRELARRHRVWCQYRPRVLEPAPSWAHGLMLQLEPGDDLQTWFLLARQVWGGRPVVLSEIQGDDSRTRWGKFQSWLRLGGAGGTHVGQAR